MSNKLFTTEEKNAIELVLSMGLIIENPENAMTLKATGFEYEIEDRMRTVHEYKRLSNALISLFKLDCFQY